MRPGLVSARMNWLGPFSWRMGPLRKTWSAVIRVRTKVSLVAVSERIQVPWNVLIVVPRSVLVTTSLNSPPGVRVRVTWTPPLTRGRLATQVPTRSGTGGGFDPPPGPGPPPPPGPLCAWSVPPAAKTPTARATSVLRNQRRRRPWPDLTAGPDPPY